MLFDTFDSLLSLLLLAGLALAADKRVWLAGDSTTAIGGGQDGLTQGWGVPAASYFSVNVSDQAIAGTSARTYYKNYWPSLLSKVVAGDVVVLEWGHNDGSAFTNASVKQSAPGTDVYATVIQYKPDGTTEVVKTWTGYLYTMAQDVLSKQAYPIISSQTPNGPDQTDTSYIPVAPRFVGYSEIAANASNVAYANHWNYLANAYAALSLKTLKTYYPNGHVHTSLAGADVAAQAFVTAAACNTKAAGIIKRLLNVTGLKVFQAASC